MSESTTLKKLIDSTKEISALQSIEELLNWDQRTQMPPKAAEYRAEQLTILSGMIHQKMTNPERGDWIGELEGSVVKDSTSDAAVIVARLSKQYHKESRIPTRLVEELAKARVLAHESWVQAREENNYSVFSKHLKTIIDLLKEKTEAIGYETCSYDVLVDDYEPEAKSHEIRQVFAGLREELVPLLEKIKESPRRPNVDWVNRTYRPEHQRELGVQAARAIGFDFDAGRLDETHHPFCCTLGPNDCRITTRYDDKCFNSAFFGTLHEAGHGLYEQGLRKNQFGLPTGEYCSLGIHESQSRLWENMVGRSLAFWKFFFPMVQSKFPQSVQNATVEDFFGAVNDVQPSLIRVEADEATYSLHIIIRFELEQEIFAGDVSVADLPEAWNEKYWKYLGIKSDSDSNGVLQDVHWSEGLFGYFPTYALGNLYAAQFYNAAEKSIGDLSACFSQGNFEPLLEWLRIHVHRVGKSMTAAEILKTSTGETLSHRPMIQYLRNKYNQIYDL